MSMQLPLSTMTLDEKLETLEALWANLPNAP